MSAQPPPAFLSSSTRLRRRTTCSARCSAHTHNSPRAQVTLGDTHGPMPHIPLLNVTALIGACMYGPPKIHDVEGNYCGCALYAPEEGLVRGATHACLTAWPSGAATMPHCLFGSSICFHMPPHTRMLQQACAHACDACIHSAAPPPPPAGSAGTANTQLGLLFVPAPVSLAQPGACMSHVCTSPPAEHTALLLFPIS